MAAGTRLQLVLAALLLGGARGSAGNMYLDVCLEGCFRCIDNGDPCAFAYDSRQSQNTNIFDCDLACTRSCSDGCRQCQGDRDQCLWTYDEDQARTNDHDLRYADEFNCDVACRIDHGEGPSFIIILIWIIVYSAPIVSSCTRGFVLCWACSARSKMISEAHAGKQPVPPTSFFKYCCGAPAVMYWEGTSCNFWIACCILPFYALCCWTVSPLPKVNDQMICVGSPVGVGYQQPYAHPIGVVVAPMMAQPVAVQAVAVQAVPVGAQVVPVATAVAVPVQAVATAVPVQAEATAIPIVEVKA